MGQGNPDSRSFKRFKTTVFSQVFAQQIFYVRLSVNNPRQATSYLWSNGPKPYTKYKWSTNTSDSWHHMIVDQLIIVY